MVDDSELDYLRTLLGYIGANATVKHFSEVKKISAINDTKRILIFPGELINVDGKFYTKRYRVQISEPSEAELMSTFNLIAEGFISLNRGIDISRGYTGVHFECITEAAAPSGITFDGTYLYICDRTTDEVYQYTTAGVYTGVHWDVSGEDSSPFGLCWDGTFFWMAGGTNETMFKYTAAGVYTTVSIDVSVKIQALDGIGWDGTHLLGMGTLFSGKDVAKYTQAGVWVSEFDTINALPKGLGWDEVHYWIPTDVGDSIARYTQAGVYDGLELDTNSQDSYMNGITYDWVNKVFWTVGYTDPEVYQYSFYTKPNILCYIELKYGNTAYEQPKTKRWSQYIYIDVEWSTA